MTNVDDILISNDKTLNLLGIAAKAGKLAFGESAALTKIRAGKAKIIILDSGSSDNTRKRFTNSALHHKVPLLFFDREKKDAARAVGRETCRTIVVVDDGFAKKISELEGLDSCSLQNDARKR